MSILLSTLACFSIVLQQVLAASTCGPSRIVSQADADALSACPTITGNVVLATNAAGDIKLNGVQSIEGNLTSELCFGTQAALPLGYLYMYGDSYIHTAYTGNNCSGLLSFTSSTLVSVSQNITFEGLLNITNITLPALKNVGTNLYLDGLPVLKTLEMRDLKEVGSFHLAYAPALSTIGINNITNASTIEINDVGLTALPSFNGTELDTLALSGIPNIGQIMLTTASITTLTVNGNGFLDLWMYELLNPSPGVQKIGTLSVSGCAYLHVDSGLSINTLIAVGNSFQELVVVADNLTSVYLQSNPQLSYVGWDNSIRLLDTLVVTGNPLLSGGVWEVENVTTVVMKGSFGRSALSTLESYLMGVTGTFDVSSTSPDMTCETFDNMRKNGVMKGSYMCQGNTVAISSEGGRGRRAEGWVLGWGVLGWIVVVFVW